jgi:hypothetical protein
MAADQESYLDFLVETKTGFECECSVLASFFRAWVSRTGPCKYYVNPYAIFLSWR